jgi:cell division septation protein DedD
VSFFSVTLMQDRLPPVISRDSVSEAGTTWKTYSPKPKLRPQNLENRILIAVGYFTMKQNLDRTLQTLELTGYPYSHKRLEEQKGSLVTVGPFTSKNSAKKALEITKFIGFSDAYILN